MSHILGLDVGTSLIKAAVYDEAGAALGEAEEKVAVLSPRAGWAEQNMEDVWRGAAKTIKSAILAAEADAEDIAAVGVAGQGDGLWTLDKAGKVFTNATLWNDSRASSIIRDWETSGALAEIFPATGTVLWPGSAAALLAWTRANRAEDFGRIGTVFCCKDFINYRLTGAVATDETDGSIPFMNLAARRYDPDVARILGLNVLDKLAPLRASHEPVGEVSREASEQTGLAAGTPVIAGMLDVVANAVGADVVSPGQSLTILGTTAVSITVQDHPEMTPANVGQSLCHSVGGYYFRVVGNMSGTPNLEWFLNATGDRATRASYDTLNAVARTVPAGAGGVIFHPYLQGERAPFLDAEARAGFFGLSADTSKAELARAVLEGVALSIKDCSEVSGASLETVVLTGGGSKSDALCQILASALNATTLIPEGSQHGTFGAALLAGQSVGLFKSTSDLAAPALQSAKRFEPDERDAQIYAELYGLYKSLRESLQPFWHARSEMLETWKTTRGTRVA